MNEKKAKLIHITKEQCLKLEEINDLVAANGGYTSITQLIREAIDILINNYSDAVIKKYMPLRIKETA